MLQQVQTILQVLLALPIYPHEGVDLLCYLTPAEHLGLPNSEEVKEGLIAYRIAAHAGDLVKIREKAIKWDREITEARRTLNWDKQISLAINPGRSRKNS